MEKPQSLKAALMRQPAYDLWQAKRHAKKLHVKQFFATAPG
jgi:hypothetical protein